MLNYTAMRQKRPTIREFRGKTPKNQVVSSIEEHVHASQVRELGLAIEETAQLEESNAKLRKFTDVAVRNLRLAIAGADANIKCGPPPKVLANHQLTLVFEKLIANAIKYRAQATPNIQISAERDQNGYWRFSVADNGIGFDIAHSDKLFSPFYRVETSEECAGTWMGLPICQEIIHQIGGRIWAHSEPQKGSTFFVCVRALPEDLAHS